MRYLRRFNESNQLDQSVIDECKHICLELEDDGFITEVNPYSKGLIITLQRNNFNYSDIEYVVERLKLFLSEFGLNIEWQNPGVKKTRVISPMAVALSAINLTPEDRDILFRAPVEFKNECKIYFISSK